MIKQEFLTGIDNQCNHRVLLWEALHLIAPEPGMTGRVVEFGSGHGSTPFLKKICAQTQREFLSYENNKEWAALTGSTLIDNWAALPLFYCDVLFLDHAPGEQRQFDLVKFRDHAKIIVIHDSEPTGGGNYQVRQHFPKFKYKCEVKTEGAWATMLSQTVDFSSILGTESGVYLISE